MKRRYQPSKNVAVRFHEHELNFIDMKRGAGTNREITRSDYIREKTLQNKYS